MIEFFQGDIKRINHALKVYGFAKAIAGKLPDRELKVVEFSAVLHDIGIREAERKHGSSAGKYQELEGPPIAEKILRDIGVDEEIIKRVSFIVGNHHSYGKIDGVDFQILVEADFLVNIFEDEMDLESVNSIRDKYFKTEEGLKVLDSMYRF
ncbi:MAG TPA: HD domain-containing protein [Clostridia bacterium]